MVGGERGGGGGGECMMWFNRQIDKHIDRETDRLLKLLGILIC